MYININDSNEEIEKRLKSYKPDMIEMNKERCASAQLSTAIRLSSSKTKSPFASIAYLANSPFEINNNDELNNYFDHELEKTRKEELHKEISFFKHADKDIPNSYVLDKQELGLFILDTCKLQILSAPTSETASALLAGALNTRTDVHTIINLPEINKLYSEKQLLEIKDWWSETFVGETVYNNKLQITEEHLNTAIELFFGEHSDYISSLALALTAFRIGRDLAEKFSIVDFSKLINKKQYFNFCNNPLNYTKHTEKDRHQSCSWDKEHLIYAIFKACQFYFLNLLKDAQYSCLSQYASPIESSPIARFLTWLLCCSPESSEMNLVDKDKSEKLIIGSLEEQISIGRKIFSRRNWDLNDILEEIYFFRDQMGLRIELRFFKAGRVLLHHKPVIAISGNTLFS